MRLPLRSETCSSHHWQLDAYRYWCEQMQSPPRFDRKQWEFVYIAQALAERGMLRSFTRGLGFGVGREPLASLFAARGCRVLATDLSTPEHPHRKWDVTGPEFARRQSLCDPAKLEELVTFRSVDMNAVPEDLRNFDFCWSACALEHLGSLELGERFIERSVATLVPGGVAVHTTDLRVDSGDWTIATGGSVVYRVSDVRRIIERLEAAGHQVEPLLIHRGSTPLDDHVNRDRGALPRLRRWRAAPPKVGLEGGAGMVVTSLGLIVSRAQ